MHFFVCPAPCVIHCIDECILVQPEALIQHAPEMGRLDRRAVVVISAPAVGRYEFQCTGRSQFSNFLHTSGSFDKIPLPSMTKLQRMSGNRSSGKCLLAVLQNIMHREQVKLPNAFSFPGRWWCMRLASAEKTHFPESDVYDIVSANLRDLFVHCCDADESVRIAANHLVSNYGLGGLRFVHRLIAEAMLGRMEDLLLESTEISEEVWSQAMECTYHLAYVLRTLTKPQRQKWVSQLVKALRSPESLQGRLQKDLFSSLQLLWRADDDPARSYAEADHQLKALLKQSSGRLQQEICKLLAC